MGRQILNRLAHMLGAGATVEPNHIHRHRFHRRNIGGDVGTEQHPPTHVEEDLGLHGHIGAVEIGFGTPQAIEGGFDFKDVDASFDQQQINPTVDQGSGLLIKGIAELLKGHIAQGRVVGRRQLTGGSNRASHVASPTIFGFILVGHTTGQTGRGDIDFGHPFAQTPFFEARARALEGTGFEHIATCLHKATVNVANDIGAGNH